MQCTTRESTTAWRPQESLKGESTVKRSSTKLKGGRLRTYSSATGGIKLTTLRTTASGSSMLLLPRLKVLKRKLR